MPEDLPALEPDRPDSAVEQRVEDLIAHTIDAPVLAEMVERQAPPDAANTLERLDEDDAVGVLAVMNDQAAADALVEMEPHLAAIILEDLVDESRAGELANMIGLLAPDDAVGLLRQLKPDKREPIFSALAHELSISLRDLIGYEPDTAAGIMTTRYVALPADGTIGEATSVVRSSEIHEDLQYLPVVDERGCLVGLVAMRDLLVHPDSLELSEVTGRSVKAVRAEVDDEDVAREFRRHDYTMMPVVDGDERLLGVVTVDDVLDLIQSEQTEDVQRSVGAGAGESVYSDLSEKIRGRLPWLFISTLLMVPASLIVLQFDGLIEQVAFLAVLMPMVAALAGNAGHQSLAVTLRGLALDEVHGERIGSLLMREVCTGLLSGALLGMLLFGIVFLLSLVVEGASWWVGLVMAIALVFSMGIGSLTGTAVPLILRRIGADPAQGSCIVLIMITDAVAFTLLLGLAWLGYSWISH
ncbi:MAG: magnesium transporter [Planctomycetota bacterium]|nr:magnesium transporter [Planctomycetota bacterium]